MTRFRQGWYIIYTRPNQEKKVAQRLENQGIEYYLPTIKGLIQWKDRKKLIERPLFPSYIFIYLRDLQTYYVGMETEGTLYYLKFGKDIAQVSDDIIRNIQLSINSGSEIEICEGSFLPGETICVCNGPLSGVSGEVVQYKGRDNILIHIHLLNRSLLVTVPSNSLFPKPSIS